MYCKKIDKLHMLTELWTCPPHITKLWFVFLMLRDEKAIIREGIKQIESLSHLTTDMFTDALDYLLGSHQDNKTQFIIAADNTFYIACLDKKERNRLDLIPLWKEKSKEGFEEYQRLTKKAFNDIVHDYSFMLDLKEFYPNHDIIKSVQNCFVLYWGTQQAWLRKRKQRVLNINWKETIRNTIKFHLVRRDTSQKDYEYDYLVEKVKKQSMIIDNAI